MRKLSTLLVLLLGIAVTLMLSGQAISQEVRLGSADGLNSEGMIISGSTVSFNIELRCIDSHLMLNNGFTFSSNDLMWGDVTGEFNAAYPWDDWFDFVMVINYWKSGSVEDTVGVGMLSLFGTGLPAGFEDVAYTFTVGPIDGPAGGILTLDSSWYPPSNPWMWDVVGENVAWGGPYEFVMTCDPCGTYTYCTPQPTILKAIESILEVHIVGDNPSQIDTESIRVQSKIPPYEGYPVVEGSEMVTACFIMRFLGSSGFRPVTGDFEATYTVDYNYLDGTAAPQLVGDFSLKVYPGDVTLDGQANIDDLIFAADYFWRRGNVPAMIDNTGQAWEVKELLDIDGNGEINPLDVRSLMGIVGFQ